MAEYKGQLEPQRIFLESVICFMKYNTDLDRNPVLLELIKTTSLQKDVKIPI